jgi:hypothetical protein
VNRRIRYVTYNKDRVIKAKDPQDSGLPATAKMILVTNGSRTLFVSEDRLEGFFLIHEGWRRFAPSALDVSVNL